MGDLNLPRQQFDIGSVRRDFPILHERVNGRPLIWLDNAATTQKPQSVIDRLSYFYEHENSNIHRAAHELAARATDAYEELATRCAHFLDAVLLEEIVFVRGATEAINLVAQAWGRQHIEKGDEIVITGSSITPISFPGRCFARKRVPACALLRSMTMARSCSMSTRSCSSRRRGWYRSPRFRMPSAP